MSRGYYPLLTNLVQFQHVFPFSSHLKNAKKKKLMRSLIFFVLFLQMRGNIPPLNDTKMQHIRSYKYCGVLCAYHTNIQNQDPKTINVDEKYFMMGIKISY